MLDQLSEVKDLMVSAGIGAATFWLIYKKLMTQGSKEDLEKKKAKAEGSVVDLLVQRLEELESTNRVLVQELVQLREEYTVAKTQNEQMHNEIRQLKKFIEIHFSPTFVDSDL